MHLLFLWWCNDVTCVPHVISLLRVVSSHFRAFNRITMPMPVVRVILTRQTMSFLRRLLTGASSTAIASNDYHLL